MCGIYGYTFDAVPKDWSIAVAVLSAEMVQRGDDSCGFYSPLGKRVRRVGAITAKIPPGEIAEHRAAIVHTRLATTGAVKRGNAHPLRAGRIIGVHNGMVRNHARLCQTYRRSFNVDSHHIFAHIDEGRDLSELQGYGAVAWCEAGSSAIHLAHSRGDLAIADVRDRHGTLGVVFASTVEAIERAVPQTGLTAVPYNVADGQVYCAEPGGLTYLKGKQFALGWGVAHCSWYGESTEGNFWADRCEQCGEFGKTTFNDDGYSLCVLCMQEWEYLTMSR